MMLAPSLAPSLRPSLALPRQPRSAHLSQRLPFVRATRGTSTAGILGYVIVGDLIYLSGAGPTKADGSQMTGKLGNGYSVYALVARAHERPASRLPDMKSSLVLGPVTGKTATRRRGSARSTICPPFAAPSARSTRWSALSRVRLTPTSSDCVAQRASDRPSRLLQPSVCATPPRSSRIRRK